MKQLNIFSTWSFAFINPNDEYNFAVIEVLVEKKTRNVSGMSRVTYPCSMVISRAGDTGASKERRACQRSLQKAVLQVLVEDVALDVVEDLADALRVDGTGEVDIY